MSWQSQCFSPWALVQWELSSHYLKDSCTLALDLPAISQMISLPVYLKLFATTCLLEAPYYYFGAPTSITRNKRLVQIILLNLATHPIVTWLFPWVLAKWGSTYGTSIVIEENFAWITEGLILIGFYRYSWRRGFSLSFFANMTSWWLGLFIFS